MSRPPETELHKDLTGTDLHVGCLSGTAAERAAFTPRVGDLWIETDTGKYYGCKTAGTWADTGVSI